MVFSAFFRLVATFIIELYRKKWALWWCLGYNIEKEPGTPGKKAVLLYDDVGMVTIEITGDDGIAGLMIDMMVHCTSFPRWISRVSWWGGPALGFSPLKLSYPLQIFVLSKVLHKTNPPCLRLHVICRCHIKRLPPSQKNVVWNPYE